MQEGDGYALRPCGKRRAEGNKKPREKGPGRIEQIIDLKRKKARGLSTPRLF